MILTVALNATVNVSYEAEEISWGAPNQISRMTSRAGGGSLAVARVLAGLGEDVLVAGFAGGGAGDLIEADLARAGVTTVFTRISRESRRVVEVVDEAREESTWLSEPAPFITTEELGRFAGEFRKLVGGMDAVVLSGGLPAGLPLDIYASLASYAAEASVPAIIHARRPGLVAQPGAPPGPGAARVHGRGPRRGGIRGTGRPGDPGLEGGGHAVRARRFSPRRPTGPGGSGGRRWRATPGCPCPRRPWWPGCCPP